MSAGEVSVAQRGKGEGRDRMSRGPGADLVGGPRVSWGDGETISEVNCRNRLAVARGDFRRRADR